MDEQLKNEDKAIDNVLKTSSQPREAILSFMAQQVQCSLNYYMINYDYSNFLHIIDN